MIRSELVACIAELNPHLYAQNVEAAVNAILARITNALAAGDRVELRNFGSFAVTHRNPREGRNPRTGAKVDVPKKAAVRFCPGKAMKKRLISAPEAGTASSPRPVPAVL